MAMTSIVTHAMHGGPVDADTITEQDVAIARVIGDVWLSALNGETPVVASATAPASTGAAPATTPVATADGDGLTLEGFAYTHDAVARLLARLTVVPALDAVRRVRSELAPLPNGTVRVHFQIGAAVRPGSPS